jgi:dolichol kinase
VSSSQAEALVLLIALAYLCHKFYKDGFQREGILLSVHALCALFVQRGTDDRQIENENENGEGATLLLRDLRTRQCASQGHFLSSFVLLALATTSVTGGANQGDDDGSVQHVVHAFVVMTVALSNFKYSQLLKMHAILQITSLCILLHASYQLYLIQQTFTWFATISIPLAVFTSELALQSCKCIPKCFTLGDALLISNACMAVVINCVMQWHATWTQPPQALLQGVAAGESNTLLTQTGLLYAAIMFIALVMRLSTGDFDQSLPSVCTSALTCFLCALLYPTGLSGLVGALTSLFDAFAANAGLLVLWALVVCVTIPTIMFLAKGDLLSNIVIRKLFHLAALTVFVSAIHVDAIIQRQGDDGLALQGVRKRSTTAWQTCIAIFRGLVQQFVFMDHGSDDSQGEENLERNVAQATDFLGFCSAVLLCAFVLCEYVRIQGRGSQFSVQVTRLLRSFTDARDSGTFIISHLSLLVGLSVPVWLHSTKFDSAPDKCIPEALLLSSGTMALGIADVLGVLIGRRFGVIAICKGSKKTLEGTVSAIAGTVVFALAWDHAMSGGASGSTALLTSQTCQGKLTSFVLACVATCLLEAFTLQLDNLYVPLFFYLLLINVN